MKRTLFAGLVLAAGAVSAATVYAQPGDGPDRGPGRGEGQGGPGGPGGPGPGGPGGPGRPMPSPVIAALDTDKDGKISKDELENAVNSLKTLDKNGDGELTPEELRPPGGPGGPGGPGFGFNADQMIDWAFRGDTNGDDKLSKEEMPERMRENFDRVDADEDGSVTKEEMKAAFERMREGGGRGPREGGDRGPREGGDRGPREGGDRGPREGGDRGPAPAESPEL